MTTYRVIVRRDAWVNYTADVDASSPEEAAQMAERAWKRGTPDIKFTEDGLTEFDEILVDPDEVEEVTEAAP